MVRSESWREGFGSVVLAGWLMKEDGWMWEDSVDRRGEQKKVLAHEKSPPLRW